MELILQFLVSAVATIAFAVLFSAPVKELWLCGFNGAIGWIIYYIMVNDMDYHAAFASTIATFTLSLLARLFAVRREMPATVYLLPGIFPLVPGAGIYYTAYYLFIGDEITSGLKGIETFEVAGAIVIGIICGAIVPQSFFNRFRKRPNDNFLGLDQGNRNFPE